MDNLPGEPPFLSNHDPAENTGLTPAQQARIRLMEELLASEGQMPAPLLPRRERTSLARLLVAAALFLAAIWSAATGLPQTTPPESSDPVQQAAQSVLSLQPGDQALVVVDYHPGAAAELEAVATSLLNNMAMRTVSLSFLSTTPTGPLQTERLLARLGNSAAGMIPLQALNLGYLSGGASALHLFAAEPAAALPEADWHSTPLEGITQLRDFELVLLLSESPESAREAIEQLAPMLPESPLLLATGAQSAPLASLYFDGSLDGYLAGIGDAASYENLGYTESGTKPASDLLSPLSTTIWISLAFILLLSLVWMLKAAPTSPGKAAD
jgi:hypothetical protein